MLFNRLVGKRMSIVEDTPGSRETGSIQTATGRASALRSSTRAASNREDSELLKFMREQAEIAIDHADVIILLTDLKPASPLGQGSGGFSAALRQAGDTRRKQGGFGGNPPPDFYEFYNLGSATR